MWLRARAYRNMKRDGAGRRSVYREGEVGADSRQCEQGALLIFPTFSDILLVPAVVRCRHSRTTGPQNRSLILIPVRPV